MKIELDESRLSAQYLINTETEHGHNSEDIKTYGELCRIEGMIKIAESNRLTNIARIWTLTLKDIYEHGLRLAAPPK